eukprot:2778667-Rhodomonas_salina.4
MSYTCSLFLPAPGPAHPQRQRHLVAPSLCARAVQGLCDPESASQAWARCSSRLAGSRQHTQPSATPLRLCMHKLECERCVGGSRTGVAPKHVELALEEYEGPKAVPR